MRKSVCGKNLSDVYECSIKVTKM